MNRKDLIAALFVFSVGLIVHGSNLRSGNMGMIAEGVSAVGAQRILEGDVPYRDFWTLYAPGSYYLLAGLFALFGSQLLTARVAAMVLVALSGVCAFGLLRTRLSRTSALLWACGVSLALFPMGHYFATYPPVVLCITAGWFAAAVYFEKRHLSWLIAAGLCCSLAVVFKHDVGGYVALSLLMTLLLRRAIGHPEDQAIGWFKEAGTFVAACGVVAVPVYLVMWAVAGSQMWRDLVVFPLTDFSASRPEHYPGILPNLRNMTSPGRAIEEISKRIRFAIPAAVFLASAVHLWIARKKLCTPRFSIQMMLTAALPFFWNAAHVQINTHIFSMMILCAAIVAVWFKDLTIRPTWRPRSLGWAIAAIFALGFLPRPAFDVARMYFAQTDLAPVGVDRADGIQVSRGIAISVRETVDHIQQHTGSDEAVYVGALRHDVIIASPVLMYFLLERPVAVRYHELHPAVADVDHAQIEMIEDLTRKNVRYTILWRNFDDKGLDQFHARRKDQLPNTGATRLDAYIHRNFQKVESFGRFEIYARRGDAIENAFDE